MELLRWFVSHVHCFELQDRFARRIELALRSNMTPLRPVVYLHEITLLITAVVR